MKAMVLVFGKKEAHLEWTDVPQPTPLPGEILIKVRASSVNRADIYQRQGGYPVSTSGGPDKPVIAGLELAGEVAGIGDGVEDFAVGDRVMAMCPGAYAEYATIDHRLAIEVPKGLSWEEAAAVPVAYMTEHNALITNGRFQTGESVLINAASSGVGIAAIQIARLFGAGPIIGMTGSAGKVDSLTALGLDVCINYRKEDFIEAVLRATDNKGVDLVIDHVGAPFLEKNLRCMALKGRLVSVGRLGGKIENLDLDFVALRRLRIIGVTFRTRTVEERIQIVRRFQTEVLLAIADGRIRPVIDRTFPLREAMVAQEYVTTNAHFGKVVLTC
jgi:NADPH2:quinone reductase